MSSMPNVVLFPVGERDEYRDEVEVNRRVDEERRRIARDLHDVASYSFAMINLQAGVAARTLENHPQQAVETLDTIRSVSNHALQELRAILGLTAPATARGCTDLSALGSLVANVESAGVPTRLVERGIRRPLPPEVERAAFRIVQESLANVLRHAGRATASVVISYEPEWLLVVVDDDGPGQPGNEGAGSGIQGMRKRARELGGDLVAGPQPARGFRVSARLPTSIRR
jgi:signal transduction histidine kinase